MSKFEEYLNETKEKYKGTYNWNKQVFTKYTHASSEKQAHNFMINQLAKEVGYSQGYVYNYFINNKNNYKIEKV